MLLPHVQAAAPGADNWYRMDSIKTGMELMKGHGAVAGPFPERVLQLVTG